MTIATKRCCLICKDTAMKPILDLGMHPCADLFIKKEHLDQEDLVWPLIVEMCSSCKFIQNRCFIEPKKRYVDIEYSFVSSHSSSAKEYWKKFAYEFSINTTQKSVLEIGSNDGFLLRCFSDLGWTTQGVDPSPIMNDIAKKNGINTFCGFIEDFDSVEKYDLVVACNVFNHLENPIEVLNKIRNSLRDNLSKIVIQVPYWPWMIRNGQYDQIYHEHVSYHTNYSMHILAKKSGLKINNIRYVPQHGSSMIIELSINETKDILFEEKEEIDVLSFDIYDKLRQKIENDRRHLVMTIHNHLQKGRKIVSIGASAKANTTINFSKLSKQEILYITDSAPTKIGKYTPLSRIEIANDSIINTLNKVSLLVTTWNLPKSVIKNIQNGHSDCKIINIIK